MLGKSKISRFLFAGSVALVFAAAFVAFGGAPEGPIQLEDGENPINRPLQQEPDGEGDIDLPEPEVTEWPEPVSPAVATRLPEFAFACPECGAVYRLGIREAEDPEDGSSDGNPDNPDDNPFELPEPDEDEPEEDELTLEFPEPEEPEGEPVEMMDIAEDEPVQPAFACPECESMYELELLKVEVPEEPEVPEPGERIEIPEPDDEEDEVEEFDLDDLLD